MVKVKRTCRECGRRFVHEQQGHTRPKVVFCEECLLSVPEGSVHFVCGGPSLLGPSGSWENVVRALEEG